MTDYLSKAVYEMIDKTRGKDGAQRFVYIPGKGVIVDIEKCVDLSLVAAAEQQLVAERDAVEKEISKEIYRLAQKSGRDQEKMTAKEREEFRNGVAQDLVRTFCEKECTYRDAKAALSVAASMLETAMLKAKV